MQMTKPKHDAIGYSLMPQNVSDQLWYYEDRRGLYCVDQPTGRQLMIPWRLLDRTFARRQATKAKRRAAT
jgi:hypothetical protein